VLPQAPKGDVKSGTLKLYAFKQDGSNPNPYISSDLLEGDWSILFHNLIT